MNGKQQTIYDGIDNFDCPKLIQACGNDKWPKSNRYEVTCNGIEFKVSVSFSKTETKLPSYYTYYDAFAAIESLHEVVVNPDMIWYEHEGPVYALVFNTDKLVELDANQIKQRISFMKAVSNLINNQNTIEAIVRSAEKKKNGTFNRKKKYKIACSGLAFNNEVLGLIGIPKTDTTMTITFDTVIPRIGDNELWANDFISTYHEGLPISDALREVIGLKDDGDESLNESGAKKLTVPDRYKAITKAPSYTTKEILENWEKEKAYYCQYIDEIEEIDLKNKTVVFDASVCTMDAFRTSPDNPIVKKALDAGAAGARTAVSGKTSECQAEFSR